MASTETEIYNLACSALGVTGNIATADESSREADLCRLWYATVRDNILGAAMWGSTRAAARLATFAIRDNSLNWAVGNPEPGWGWAFLAPSDMLRPRYMTDFSRFTLALTNTTTPTIMSNTATPILVYTMRQTRVDLWSADLALSIIHGLAAKIAKDLTGSRSKMMDNYQIAQDTILLARANAANEIQSTLEFGSSSMSARGYANNSPVTPYIYNNAEFSLGGSNVG